MYDNFLFPEDFEEAYATDHGNALRLCFRAAAESGRPVKLSAGRAYTINSTDENDPSGAIGILLQGLDKDLTVLGDGAKVYCRKGIQSNPANPGAFFRAETVSDQIRFDWRGGQVIMEGMPPAAPGVMTVGGLAIVGPWDVSLRDMTFNHGYNDPTGTDVGVGGGDQSAFLSGSRSALVDGCSFLHAPDLGVYASATLLKNLKIVNSHFFRCRNAIAFKRKSGRFIISNNTIEECNIGIYTPTADNLNNNAGQNGIVTGNILRKIQQAPIDINGDSYASVVSSNIIEDFGCRTVDGQHISTGERPFGIRIRASGSIVSANALRMKDWIRNETSPEQTTGILFSLNGHYPQTSGGAGVCVGNTVSDVHTGLYVASGVGPISNSANQFINCIA